MVTLQEDLRLRPLLDVALGNAYSDLDNAPAILDEVLPMLIHRIYSVDSIEDIYEHILIEQSIARLRHEALQLDASLQKFFNRVPKSLVEQIYEIDIDGSKRYLTQSDWEYIQSYCRSFVLTDRLIPLFNMSSEVLKNRTAELISQYIFDDKYGGKSGTNWLTENEPLPASQRPELLLRCGVIDSELKNNIQEVVDYRNQLIHEMGKWRSLESPGEILDKLELAISTIESVDDLLLYSPHVRLHQELSPFDIPHDVDLERTRDALSGEEDLDFETATDVVEKEILRNAVSDKNSPFHYGIAAVLNDEDQLIEAFESFWRQDLHDAEGEEFNRALLGWASIAKKNFDVNVFETLYKKERYHSRLPDQFLSQNFIEWFDQIEF